jgi:hypothetical protein
MVATLWVHYVLLGDEIEEDEMNKARGMHRERGEMHRGF